VIGTSFCRGPCWGAHLPGTLRHGGDGRLSPVAPLENLGRGGGPSTRNFEN
jgi:hypothetical protein